MCFFAFTCPQNNLKWKLWYDRSAFNAYAPTNEYFGAVSVMV